jgi:hypothetical protein
VKPPIDRTRLAVWIAVLCVGLTFWALVVVLVVKVIP